MPERDPHDETASVGPAAGTAAGTRLWEVAANASTPHPRQDDTAANYPAIPGYRIAREIGHGGMGVVYEADEPRFHRRVALKVLRASFDGAAVRKRFEAEAAILSQLDHPNVVRVYAAGEAGPWVYYAMKLVERGPLSNSLAMYATAAAAVRLVAKLAHAVQYLHDRGVWHRDLKPSNILLDADGEPLVADFGVAKWVEGETHTVGFTRVGTYAYMAPEMIEFGSVRCGPPADVWSLGVMLYELLAGVRPFPGDNRDPSLPGRVVNAAPPPLADSPALSPGTDDRLEAIVLRALAKDAAHRYPSAAALAADLNAWLGDGTTDTLALPEARRHATRAEPSTVSATAPLPPRRRWRATAAVGLLVVLVGVLAVALFWPRKPTLLAEYEATGEVVIVDSEGNRRHPLTAVPGSQGGLQPDPDGFLVAMGSPLALFEISAKAPPPPYRLRAKVYHLWGELDPFVGVYVRRAGHPALRGAFEEHDCFALGLDTYHTGNDRPGKIMPAGVWLDPNQQVRTSFMLNSFPERAAGRHRIDPKDFRELVIDVRSDGVTCAAEGQPFEPVPWPLAEFGHRDRRLALGRPVPEPVFGDGFGLVVLGGAAGVRDVVLSRLP